jgi:two-component system OmpR family sensor kinase
MTRSRPGWPQLRTQVLAGVLLITLVALAAFDVAAVSALRRYLLDRTDSNLAAVVSLYRSGAPPGLTPRRVHIRAPSGKNPSSQIVIVGPRFRLQPSILDQYYLAFIGRHGSPKVFIEGNPNLVPRFLGAISVVQQVQTVPSRNGHAQLRLQVVRRAGGTLVASTSIVDVDKTVGQLRLILVLGSVAAGLLVAAGVVLVLRRGLRPIEVMAFQADRITAGDLTDRVSPHDPRTEVGRLGTALNGMLTRIETSVAEREVSQELTRQFFADASHELRTPLASLRANAELYQQGALTSRPQVDEAMRRITLEAQRMSRLVDDMLRLARLDQHPGQEQDLVDLSALLGGCAERAQIAGPRRTWRTDISPGLVTTGDAELLRRAVDNLLSNVRAHTPGGTVATITATSCGDTISIEVSDDGPGVAPDELPRIFDRFHRVAPAQASCPGSGLGLAIVAAVVTAHRGTAHAEINPPHGLRIIVSLPAEDEP